MARASNKVNISRSEGISIRPFSGLDALDKVVEDTVALEIQGNFGMENLVHRSWISLASHDIKSLGLKIIVRDLDGLKLAIAPLVMDLEDVDVLFVAHDRASSTLRETVVLQRLNLMDLQPETVLNRPGMTASARVLDNARSGFEVELAFVLNKSSDVEFSLKPRVLGFLLSKAVFQVRHFPVGMSFQPEPLTDDERERLGLSKYVLSYFEPQAALLTAENSREAARFYVHEDILANIQFLTGDILRLSETYLLTQFVSGLIYACSIELRDAERDDEWTEQVAESCVVRLLESRFKGLSLDELLLKIEQEPERLIADWLATPGASKAQITIFKNLAGGTDVLSSPDE